jgi:GNAT superfamily N-acetyltransferase
VSGAADARAPATGPGAAGPRLRLRRADVADARQLINLYLGLSGDARRGFHPFPFQRWILWVIYPVALFASRAGRPMMRRFPRLIVVFVVAELEGTDGFVGYGTLRGETPGGEPPRVRFGFVVRDGFRGHRVGAAVLHRLSEEGYELGIQVGVGAVFRRDERAIKAIRGFGWQFRDTTRRDPQAPEEEMFETFIDLGQASGATASAR